MTKRKIDRKCRRERGREREGERERGEERLTRPRPNGAISIPRRDLGAAPPGGFLHAALVLTRSAIEPTFSPFPHHLLVRWGPEAARRHRIDSSADN